MFKPIRMERLTLTASKLRQREIIEILHQKNVAHINEFTEAGGGIDIGAPLENAGRDSSALVKLRSILTIFEEKDKDARKKYSGKMLVARIEKELDTLSNKISDLANRKNDLVSSLDRLKSEHEEIQPFCVLPLSLKFDFDNLKVFVGYVNKKTEVVLKHLPEDVEVYPGKETKKEKRKLIAIFSPLECAKDVEDKLTIGSFEFIDLPDIKGSIGECKVGLENKMAQVKKEIKELEKELDKLWEENKDFILAAEEHLAIEVEKAEAPLKFATTEHFFLVDFWVPKDRSEKLIKELESVCMGKVHIEKVEEDDPDSEEYEPPVTVHNPKVARPFESLIGAFAIPNYREIDPTILVFITFPIFFGFMLGDIAYGALIMIFVLIGLFTKLFKVFGMESAAPHLNKVLFIAGIWTIIFGVIYGELFGFTIYTTHEHAGVLFPEIHYGQWELFGFDIIGKHINVHLPIDRFLLEDIKLLIILSVLIGIAHLYLGWFLGFRNVAKAHGMKHAVIEKGGWILVLTGGLMFCFELAPYLMFGADLVFGQNMIVGLIILGVGMALLIAGEGPIAAMELPTVLLSNTLSYTRLFAIGLSSAGIALAFNNMAMENWHGGGAGIVLAVVILFLGHTLNFLLGIIGPGVHSLRLHYVEFFTKFYEGGGELYKPFGRVRKYTED